MCDRCYALRKFVVKLGATCPQTFQSFLTQNFKYVLLLDSSRTCTIVASTFQLLFCFVRCGTLLLSIVSVQCVCLVLPSIISTSDLFESDRCTMYLEKIWLTSNCSATVHQVLPSIASSEASMALQFAYSKRLTGFTDF